MKTCCPASQTGRGHGEQDMRDFLWGPRCAVPEHRRSFFFFCISTCQETPQFPHRGQTFVIQWCKHKLHIQHRPEVRNSDLSYVSQNYMCSSGLFMQLTTDSIHTFTLIQTRLLFTQQYILFASSPTCSCTDLLNDNDWCVFFVSAWVSGSCLAWDTFTARTGTNSVPLHRCWVFFPQFELTAHSSVPAFA